MLLRELVEQYNIKGRRPAGPVLFRDWFVAHCQEPALTYISAPEAQEGLDSMVQDFVEIKIESGAESIRRSTLGVAGKDALVPTCLDLESLHSSAAFRQQPHPKGVQNLRRGELGYQAFRGAGNRDAQEAFVLPPFIGNI